MKILLIEKNREQRDVLAQLMTKWGFIVLNPNDEESIGSLISRTPEIQIVVVGQTDQNPAELIQTIRGAKLYRFILCIVDSDKGEGIDSYFDAGADAALKVPVEPRELRSRLIVAQRILNHSFKLDIELTPLRPNKPLQALNLEMALAQIGNDKPLFKELLAILVESAKEIEVKIGTLQSDLWDELHQNAETLGAEELASWVTGIIALKSRTELYHFLNFAEIQRQLDDIIARLSMGFSFLEKQGFFLADTEELTIDPLTDARVLLVEDLVHNRLLVRQILKKHSCRISEAVNGEEAVKAWSEAGPFDLVIMDMNMPIMDGFTATGEIRKMEKARALSRTPILALTALAMRGDHERCLAAGCDGYIPKPVEGPALIQTCRDLLSDSDRPTNRSEMMVPAIHINRILLRVPNQVYRFSIQTILNRLELEWIYIENGEDLLSETASGEFDLVILDIEQDLELAYQIKDQFPLKHILLIAPNTKKIKETWIKTDSILYYPFQQRDVELQLQRFSVELAQARKNADVLDYAHSLDNMKGHVSIQDCIQKSDNQLAVWQKAFRKVGGDLVLSHEFNFHGKFGFILADVAGHDIKSGYAASWFAGLVKGLWGQHSNPLDMLIYLNNLFAHDSEEEDKRFVCALVLLWDRQRHKLLYANAGIPGGILVRHESGGTETIHWKGVPIGMFPDMDMFDNGVIDFEPGDRLYMATDGVLEAIPSDVILNISREKSHKKPKEALNAIVDFVTRSIEILDDLTLCVFEGHELPPPDNGFRDCIVSTFNEVDRIIAKIKQFIDDRSEYLFDWSMISVAIRESLINAIEHGNQSNPELFVDIDVNLKGRILQVIVSDSGGGFDLPSVKKRLEKEGDLRIQGRGIELMESISQSMSYRGGGLKLEFAAEN